MARDPKEHARHQPIQSKVEGLRVHSVRRVVLLARPGGTAASATLDVFDKPRKDDTMAKKDTLAAAPAQGNLLAGELSAIPLPAKPDQSVTLYLDITALADMWLAVTWSG